MSRHQNQFIDLYCWLPNEFSHVYSKQELSFDKKDKKKKIHRNKNALQSKPSLSSQFSKSKLKNFLEKDSHFDDIHTCRRKMINKIMSIDHQIESSMQMADGDKKSHKTLKDTFDKVQQEKVSNHREYITHMMDNQSKESYDLKSLKNSLSHFSSSHIDQSTSLRLNRTSTWRKLQANITSTHYNYIQEFQQERQKHPIMLSPSRKPSEIENSEILSNITSLSIKSSTDLTASDSSHRIIQSAGEGQQTVDEDSNEVKLIENDSLTNVSLQNFSNVPSSSSPQSATVEEFQPALEIVSPSNINNILSSFFPSISTSVSPTLTSDNTSLEHPSQHHIDKLLIINQPSAGDSEFISEIPPVKKVDSVFESIEELCILIRKLLQHELSQQKITILQATIANQLAILLTYLAIPKNTIEKMTSTDNNEFSTIGTQTDFEWNRISESMLVPPSNELYFHTQQSNISHEFQVPETSSSFENEQNDMLDIPLLSSQKVASHTESVSTSVTFHLPGHRLHHALSDTFICNNHHQQQSFASYHKLISFSETTIHSLMHHQSTRDKTQHLLKHIRERFRHYIELESSNTCLEASTEFTPDFLLTTINNSKHDDEDDQDQTEQFGIDTEKQNYQTDTISLIINKNQEKIDTNTFDSTEKVDYDSLQLDIEQDNNEANIEQDDTSKSSLTEIHSLRSNNTMSVSLNNQIYSYQLIQSIFNISQWQLPILPRKTNSNDIIYEKHMSKIDFKHLKIRSKSNNEINFIGKRVRIQPNSSSQISTPTIKLCSNQTESKKFSALNYNNNSYHENLDAIQTTVSSTSTNHMRLSATSIDSLCSLDNDSINQPTTLSNNLLVLRKHLQLDSIIHSNYSNHIKTMPFFVANSLSLSDIIYKFNSNNASDKTLFNIIDTFNIHNNNCKSSTINTDVLQICILHFLIEFDARIRLERKRRKNCRKKTSK